ncbi:MAG: transcriptional repressor [Clostridium argentinense]|nr:transcriptional repressor [Clostridium argentinense]
MLKPLLEEANYIEDKLVEKGYKLTIQRQTIVNVILENKSDHLSVREIYEIVKMTIPHIGIATIYRTVFLLREMGFVNEIDLGDGLIKYEFIPIGSNGYHPHLICLNCRKIIEIGAELLNKVELAIENGNKFKINNYNIIFYGLCSICNEGG